MKKLTFFLSFILLVSLFAVPVAALVPGSEATPYVTTESFELPPSENAEGVLEVPQLQDIDIDELDDINESFLELGEQLVADAKEMEDDTIMAMGYPYLDYEVFTYDGLFSLYWQGAKLVDVEDEEGDYRNLQTFDGSLIIDLKDEEVLDREEILERYGLEEGFQETVENALIKAFDGRSFGDTDAIQYLDCGFTALNFGVTEEQLDEASLSLAPDGRLMIHLKVSIPADGLQPFIPFVLEPEYGTEDEELNPLFVKYNNFYGEDPELGYVLHLGNTGDFDEETVYQLALLAGEHVTSFTVADANYFHTLDSFDRLDPKAYEDKELFLFVPRYRHAVLAYTAPDRDEHLYNDAAAMSYGTSLFLADQDALKDGTLELRYRGEVTDITPEVKRGAIKWDKDLKDLTKVANFEVEEFGPADFNLYSYFYEILMQSEDHAKG